MGAIEHSATIVVLVVIVAVVACGILANNWWRIRQYQWWASARNNRNKHPDLAREYQRPEREYGDRFIIAQQMMMRDREKERNKHSGDPSPNYPTVWEYYFRPGKEAFLLREDRAADRKSDLEGIRGGGKKIVT